MLKANFKSVFFITLITTSILVVGCSSPEEKKAQQIEAALSLSAEGSNDEALEILEGLATLYPNDLEILNSIGQIYSAQGDPAMAAFFLEQAYLQSPDDTELLFQTYQSLEAADQPASHLLEKLAIQAPKAMTPELWIRLGQARQAENKVQPALDAYLKGVDPDKTKPSSETAAAIGQLFVKVDNLPLAESWLKIAADNDDPNALTALFGLLEINLRQKDWADAEATIAQLNKQFPGAVEASQWQQANKELIRWRQAQDAMKAKLAKAEADKKAAETAAAKAKAEQATQAAAAKAAAAIAQATETKDSKQSKDSGTEEPGGKAQIIADLEAAEAMADAPAIEGEMPLEIDDDITIIENIQSATASSSSKAITFDPNIAIEPADPEFTFEVSYDQAPIAEETSYTIDANASLEPMPTQTVEAYPEIEAYPNFGPEAPLEPIRASERPRTIEELTADAETATLDRDYKSAIRKYWAAISIANNRADIWNLLSRAYLIDGQLKNAETTALEAVRLEPREVAYTLDYLRVAQRSKEPTKFLAELETAYDRFPRSPEITLSLARGHERISQDRATAHNLYLRFIDIAPNHPLIPEARAAVARLR
ncbi:tetratricopeptide repeat protein [Coraliomargarita sp. W4R53]